MASATSGAASVISRVTDVPPVSQPQPGVSLVCGPQFPPRTIPAFSAPLGLAVAKVVAENANSDFVVFANKRMTFAETKQLMDKITVALLAKMGLSKGDPVATFLPNVPENPAILLATICASLIFSPLNPGYMAEQVIAYVSRIKPKIIFAHSSNAGRIRDVVDPVIPIVVLGTTLPDGPNVLSFDSLIGNLPQVEPGFIMKVHQSASPNDVVAYASTGGSTSGPKLCIWTLNVIRHSIIVSFQGKARIMLPLPFYASTGTLTQLFTFFCGGTLVCTETFDLHEWLELASREHCNSLTVAPSLLLELLAGDYSYDLSNVKYVISTGASASQDMLSRAQKKFDLAAAFSVYGMTETAGRVARSIVPFQVWPYMKVRIADTTSGTVVATGLSGEIQVQGPTVFAGYLGEPELTARAFTSDGWLKTGDIGHFDDKMFLHITGRIKEMINRGGMKVWPADLEAVLATHPGIQEAAVIGIPDILMGESVVAFVIRNPLHTPPVTVHDVRNFMAAQVVAFCVPQYVFFVESFERNSAGKTYKPALCSMAPKLVEDYWTSVNVAPDLTPSEPLAKEIANIWHLGIGIPVHAISIDSNFFELGGNSIVAGRTHAVIRKEFPETPGNILVLCPTIRQIMRYLESKDTSGDNTNWTVESALETTTVAATLPPPAPPVSTTSRVFLTGSNGFLGVHVLHAILSYMPNVRVVCGIRAANKGEAYHKLESAFSLNKSLDPSLLSRVEVIVIDLSLPLLGLTPEELGTLSNSIDGVFHCAAAVSWVTPYRVLSRHNIFGTKQILYLASLSSKGPLPVHFVSTYEVRLDHDENASLGEVPPEIPIPYIQSKWVSEKLVKEAGQRGVPFVIYRPGAVSGHSVSGVTNSDDFYMRFLKGCIELGGAPESGTFFPLCPVDQVAKTIVDIMFEPTSTGKTFNITPSEDTPYSLLWDVAREAGYQIRSLRPQEWGTLLASAGPTNSMSALSFLFQRPKEATATTKPTKCPRSNLDSLLPPSPEHNMTPSRECIRRYIQVAIQAGFLPPVPSESASSTQQETTTSNNQTTTLFSRTHVWF
ncbi:4-coumarate--CoA ligase [Pelomyxa schiedti]|nr:4-coumarate--CoA ligase [Pelomyxa schiedti]